LHFIRNMHRKAVFRTVFGYANDRKACGFLEKPVTVVSKKSHF
jgi:hypothetical protein